MTRLVNVYIVHSIIESGGLIYLHTTGADASPKRQPEIAARIGAAGILIHDVHTGERWFQPASEPPAGLPVLLDPLGAFG
jgi:hypothetical protein